MAYLGLLMTWPIPWATLIHPVGTYVPTLIIRLRHQTVRTHRVFILTKVLSAIFYVGFVVTFETVQKIHFGYYGGPWEVCEENCDLGFDLKQSTFGKVVALVRVLGLGLVGIRTIVTFVRVVVLPRTGVAGTKKTELDKWSSRFELAIGWLHFGLEATVIEYAVHNETKQQ
jgi:hypothetical protein